jgi:hypothetical protein
LDGDYGAAPVRGVSLEQTQAALAGPFHESTIGQKSGITQEPNDDPLTLILLHNEAGRVIVLACDAHE